MLTTKKWLRYAIFLNAVIMWVWLFLPPFLFLSEKCAYKRFQASRVLGLDNRSCEFLPASPPKKHVSVDETFILLKWGLNILKNGK